MSPLSMERPLGNRVVGCWRRWRRTRFTKKSIDASHRGPLLYALVIWALVCNLSDALGV